MKVACFSTKSYDEQFLNAAVEAAAFNSQGHEFRFLEARLDETTVKLAESMDAVCVFVNDDVSESVCESLARYGVRCIVLRCAGFNNVDLQAADRLGLRVARVPRYSPYAVAEHTIGLILTLNRKIHKAYNRVRENNFSIDGLLGFDLNGRTFGIIGTGAIGVVLAKIVNGFGCEVLLCDPCPSEQAGRLGRYVELDELLRLSDIVSLHCPLTNDTYHLIDEARVNQMKPEAMLVNTSRGGLIDATAVIAGLKTKKLGGVALDVYEEESGVFFEDLSQQIIQDDVLSRLMTFPNVLVTSHQAFFTKEALVTIASTTIANLDAMSRNESTGNDVTI